MDTRGSTTCCGVTFQGSAQPGFTNILCHLQTPGSLGLTLGTSREPGALQAGGFQLSQLGQQPHWLNSKREERANVDIQSLACKKVTLDLHKEKQLGISLRLEILFQRLLS